MMVTLEEAWKRDSLRENGVGQSVIYKQWLQWLDFIGRKRYIPQSGIENAVIVDIDGTVAEMAGKRGPFEWHKVHLDEPRMFILRSVEDYYRRGLKIIFVSGRDSICRHETKEWLENHLHSQVEFELFMRKEGDIRKDTEVKEEIFWNNIAPNWNVVAALDDRPCVLRLWHEIGIPNVISVGNPWIEF